MSRGHESSARTYHEATKHSEVSLRSSGHYLDWDSRPSPFKLYKNLDSISLPRDFARPSESALEAIREQDSGEVAATIDLSRLSEILFFSAGLTRKMRFGSEAYFMRAASATGALYPIELYVVATNLEGLASGVYHFNPLEFALVRIREGDYGSVLAEATDDATRSSMATIAMASLGWRNAWKYEARSYRHWFWDAGVIAANLLAVCHSEHIPIRLLMGFIDSDIDTLLDLKPGKEATVALGTIIGSQEPPSGPPVRQIQHLNLETEPLSRNEFDYPIIWETNSASGLSNRPEVRSWLQKVDRDDSGIRRKVNETRSHRDLDSATLEQVILQRGSTRRFSQKPIQMEALSAILEASTGPVPGDFLSRKETLIDFYMIINDVEGLEPGSYYYNRTNGSLELLKQGKLRHISGYLCLEQLLFSDASVVLFLMADLGTVLDRFGDRGYRAAQFEGGIRAGKIYLSSYALGIGASGSTFFDDAVTEFFSPHANKKSTMIAVGIGIPAYKSRPGKILSQFTRRH